VTETLTKASTKKLLSLTKAQKSLLVLVSGKKEKVRF